MDKIYVPDEGYEISIELSGSLRPGPGPYYNNPFALLFEGEKGKDYRAGKAVTSFATWKDLALMLLRQVMYFRDTPFREELWSQTCKHGTILADGAVIQRGSRLADEELLVYISDKSGTSAVRWGPLRYETQTVFDSHFCVVGKPRTGKTTILKLLFQSVFSDLDEPTRFIFYDAKPDLLPCMTTPEDLLRSPDSSELPVYLLAPFDERSTAWDIAKDATNRTKSEHIADVLFGVGSPDEDFFDAAAPTIAASAMDALNRKAGDNWTFYDLIMALRPENIEAVLTSNDSGKQDFKTYFQSPATSSSDLIKTLANKTKVLRPVAYAWTHAKDRLSLSEWVNSQTKSIVLANNDEFAKASKEINRILLNILTEQLLGKENPPAPSVPI